VTASVPGMRRRLNGRRSRKRHHSSQANIVNGGTQWEVAVELEPGSNVLWIWAPTLRKGVGSVDPLAREETTNPIFTIHPAQTRYVAEAC